MIVAKIILEYDDIEWGYSSRILNMYISGGNK